MPAFTDIKSKIRTLGPAQFQEFCDLLLSKMGYCKLLGYGMEPGTGNTTKGNPDSYFRCDNGKYIFAAYTTQKTGNIFNKLRDDIIKCLDPSKTGVNPDDIEEIICCHTSANLSAGDDQKLHQLCDSRGIRLSIYGVDELARLVIDKYRSLLIDYLDLNIDTGQIMDAEDFIALNDSNEMSAPLSTKFLFRNQERHDILEALNDRSVVIVSGNAGVGKTRLVLETARDYSSENSYQLLCVKNNGLNLSDDFISATEQPGKYLFFIDDANELGGLKYILSSIINNDPEKTIKIIATVRDYAKKEVISKAYEYTTPRIISVGTFTDDEIREFIKENFDIRNEVYIKQITRIAEGNPRIAYMASKLAAEKNDISAVRDASGLFDAYYKNYVSRTIGEDADLCFVAGILAIVGTVIIDRLSSLKEILDKYGISEENFVRKIRKLTSLEVAEIREDKVARMSDQCFSNYMLYYAFFENKLFAFSDILVMGFNEFSKGILRSVNTILNVFDNLAAREYCRQEINIAWKELEQSKAHCYDEFVKAFHVFRPENSFIYVRRKLSVVKSEFPKDVCFGSDFLEENSKQRSYSRYEGYLDYLTGYKFSENIHYVIDILLEYCGKGTSELASGVKWLENEYGIDVDSIHCGFYPQKTVSSILLSKINSGNKIAEVIGTQWASYALGFTFNPVEMGRKNAAIFYTINLQNTKGVQEYRHLCWMILKYLTDVRYKGCWNDRIITTLNTYAKNLRNDPDNSIVAAESGDVKELAMAVKCGKIGYLITVYTLKYFYDKLNVSVDFDLAEEFSGDLWLIYQTLSDQFLLSGQDYDDYEKTRAGRIENYGKSLRLKDVSEFVQYADEILADPIVKDELFGINHGILMVAEQLGIEREKVFVEAFIHYGEHINIHPDALLLNLFRKGSSDGETMSKHLTPEEVLRYLKAQNFPQKNEWIFSLFDTFPDDQIDAGILQEFLEFLRNDNDRTIQQSSYRNLKVLDKFLAIEPDIYPIASSIIYQKRNYSQFIVKIYFDLLFNENLYSPADLLRLFGKDIKLLQDIYFFLMQGGEFIDYHGTFLLYFLQSDESWLQKYNEFFWKQHLNDYYCELYKALWKTDKYQTYFDYLFYHAPYDEKHSRQQSYLLRHVFVNSSDDDTILEHQKSWIKHIVTDNADQTVEIKRIFLFASELGEDIRRVAIQTLLERNDDIAVFRSISLIPIDEFATDSIIPTYSKDIHFLESLFPYVSDIKHLEYKECIMNKIESLLQMIENAKIEEIIENALS